MYYTETIELLPDYRERIQKSFNFQITVPMKNICVAIADIR